MHRRIRFSVGARALALAVVFGAVVSAHAGDPWDLGPVTMTNTALAPGTNGGSSGPWSVSWVTPTGSYSYYAGGFTWDIFNPGSNTTTHGVQTLCASLFQEFNPSSPFGAHEYWLDSANNNGSGSGGNVHIGDGQVLGLPGADTGNPGAETADKFLTAAELFGYQFGNLGSQGTSVNEAYAALQLAIWDTLYGSNVTVTVNGSANLNSDYSYDLGLIGDNTKVNASALSHVIWFDHTTSGDYGQSQFGYTNGPPAPTPEPVTIALGIAGLALGIRRRVKSKA